MTVTWTMTIAMIVIRNQDQNQSQNSLYQGSFALVSLCLMVDVYIRELCERVYTVRQAGGRKAGGVLQQQLIHSAPASTTSSIFWEALSKFLGYKFWPVTNLFSFTENAVSITSLGPGL